MNGSIKRTLLTITIVIFSGTHFVAIAQQNIPAAVLKYADTVLYNGQVITADEDFSITEALAIRDGKILAVGATDEIMPLAGPNTRSIDLNGRSVTPGFIYSDGDNAIPGGDLVKDSQWGGTMQQQIGGQSMEQLEQTFIHIVENEALPGEMIFMKVVDQWAGPIMDTWTREQLDEISPENPTILLPGCCYAIVNTPMLNLMLEQGFPVEHLHLIKNARGEPTGQLGSNAVGFIGRELRPFPPPEWIRENGIKGAIETIGEYAAEGITTATGHMTGLTVLILNQLYKEGNLAIRIHPALDTMRQNTFPERTLARIGNIMDFALVDERGPMVQIVGTSVGPHAGAPDDATGIMTIEPKTTILPELGESPYGYDQWSAEYYTGKKSTDLTEDELRQTEFYNIQVARQYGYNVNGVHNMGSGGILLAMQAIVEAENQDVLYVPELSRAQAFDHNIDWTPEVFEYFEEHKDFLQDKLRVGISLRTAMNQRDALIYGYEDLLSLQYGWDGLERLAPLKSLLDAGIPFHIEGTDPNNPPLWIVKKAVTRVDRKGRVVAPDEAITREQAILALTRWAARFLSAEDEFGSLEAGKWADVVVFDGRVMDVPIEEIDTLKPVLTLVGGRVAFESDNL